MDSSTTHNAVASYESRNVHDVYDSIATHFSQTRYKPWPVVAAFLDSIPAGSVGIEVGCGNGKYLHGHNVTASKPASSTPAGGRPPGEMVNVEPRYLLLGLDRSLPLLQHAPSNAERIYADGCPGPSRSGLESLLPFRAGSFDFALSIATIHHFSTSLRRRQGVQALISAVIPPSESSKLQPHRIGRILIYAWAFEQGPASRRRWEKGTLLNAEPPPGAGEQSLNGNEGPHSQDVFVPWTVPSTNGPGEVSASPRTLNRYYHLFRKGELQALVKEAAEAMGLRLLPDFNREPGKNGSKGSSGWIKVIDEGYEADNWYISCEVGR